MIISIILIAAVIITGITGVIVVIILCILWNIKKSGEDMPDGQSTIEGSGKCTRVQNVCANLKLGP